MTKQIPTAGDLLIQTLKDLVNHWQALGTVPDSVIEDVVELIAELESGDVQL